MHFQIKQVLRLNACAPLQGKRTVGRKPWTVSAAQKHGERATERCAPAAIKRYFALQSCRSYASDTAYGRAFGAARDNPETFWGDVGQDIRWFQPWRKTLHVEDPVFPNW